MRTVVRHSLVAVWLVSAAVVPARAQVQTGNLSIKAVDEQGGIMPGASVSITSPVLPRAIEGITDAGGVFQVPGLTSATYTVKVTLQGFQTYIREDVILRQGQTVSIDAPMKVGSLTEALTVKGESPIVDTRTVGSKTNIDSALLETTPGGKDIWNILEYKAPGVVVETPDVGGNQGGLQRSMSARGTPNAQNTQMLNGVNVNDPAAQGFSMNYYIPSAFDNIQVSTGAQDISIGTGGVLINMVTKSGTNQYAGQALQTYQTDGTQAANVDQNLLSLGFRPDANSTELISNSNFQLGGPVLKNRMFFFGSANYQATHINVPDFPSAVPSYVATPLANTSKQDTTDILAGEGKITYQMGRSDRFEGYLSKQRYDKPNRGAASGLTQESDSKELDTFVIAQLSYNRVLNDRMFVDAKVSYNNTRFPLYQKTDLQPLTDQSNSNALYRNRNSSQIMFRRRLQTIANWQYYLPTFTGGRHEFKGGFDNGYTPEDVDTIRVEDVNVSFRSLPGPGPTPTTVTIFNTPLHQERAVMSTALYGQDSFTRGRLNVIGGIRWERVEGYLPAQTTPSSRFFPDGLTFVGVTINNVVTNYTVKKSFDAIHDNPLWYNWAPRIAATYDLFGNGKTALKASWGRYLDQINTGTPPNPNANINQVYAWNDLNGDLNFQPGDATWDGLKYVGGEFGALNQQNGLAVAVFDKSVRRPKRDEITVTLDHELFRSFLLDVSYLRTREKDPQGTTDDSIDAWGQNYARVTLTDPGRDGVLGTSDDLPLDVYNLNAGVTPVTKQINDKRLANRYDGLDVIVTKRYEDGWTLLAGYTYSHQEVDLTSLANPNNAFVNASGVSGGRRHNLKASGSYTLPYQVVAAANFRLQSGLPITRTWNVPTCSTTITANCVRQTNLTVNAEPRGSVELGTLPTLDLRFGRYFDFRRDRVELSVDLYNVTNANTIFGVRNGTGLTGIRVNGDLSQPLTQIQTFMSPTQFLAPRVLRFNVTYNFNRR